jgi:pimeloyl-ACP methyl ester carboxylesterase
MPNLNRFTGPRIKSSSSAGFVTLLAVSAIVAAATINRHLSKKAERDNPPQGRFIEIDGVRLHYVERGQGPALVLLHGNGSMIQDFESSGLIDMAAKSYRVIAFDRPGYGHSTRPRGTVWTPDAQARLLQAALASLGVPKFTLLGHSWGASVAVALALAFPNAVSKLVLASGYYYPTPRLDVILLSGPAIPAVGDVIAHTISPMAGRIMWPLALKKIFGPAPVPAKFAGFPKELALRPSQMRASSAEAAMMIPDAFAYSGEYHTLKMPVTVIAGEDDRLIDIDSQSARLHREISGSKFRQIKSHGHMIHQTATAEVMAAIDESAA